MKHKFLLIYSWFIRTSLFFLPDLPFIMRFRGFLYGLGMNSCGKNLQVSHSAILNSLEFMSIGNHVYIANFCNIIANGSITIEDEVIFGPSVILAAGNHQFLNKSFRFSKSKPLPIKIKRGSWIGANCTIVGNSIFPDTSILAANSVYRINQDISNNSLFAGNPAQFIKDL